MHISSQRSYFPPNSNTYSDMKSDSSQKSQAQRAHMSTQGMLYLPLPALNHAFAYPNTQHLHSLSYLSIHITSPRLSRTISAHLPDPNCRPIIDQVDYRQGSFVFKAPVLECYCLELPCFTSGRWAHDSLLWRLSWPPPSHVPLRNHAHPSALPSASSWPSSPCGVLLITTTTVACVVGHRWINSACPPGMPCLCDSLVHIYWQDGCDRPSGDSWLRGR
jgi:hypothetical protein